MEKIKRRPLVIVKQLTPRGIKSLALYQKEINKIPLLTREEQYKLAQQMRAGDKQAEEKLIKCNLRFVFSVAKQYLNRGLSLPDLINEGNLGLYKAAEKFDETRGFKFISCAVWWIRIFMVTAIKENANIVHLPGNKVANYSKTKKARNKLEQKLHRRPTEGEIADELMLSEKSVRESIESCRKDIWLDAPLGSGCDNFSRSDLLADTENLSPDNRLSSNGISEDLELTIDEVLDPLKAEIIRMSFGIGFLCEMSPEQICDHYQGRISPTDVRKLKKEGLSLLKKRLIQGV